MKTLQDALAPFRVPTGQTADYVPYSESFLDLMTFVLPHECEFQSGHYGDFDFIRTEHDPSDPGGTTRYGLDAESHPHVDIDALSLADALGIYHDEIWTPLRGDDLPGDVSLSLCDAAINCGTARAVRWLQGIVGVTVDGNIGPVTVAAVQAGEAHQIASAFNARRLSYYQTEVRPGLQKLYLAGWENRMTALAETLA